MDNGYTFESLLKKEVTPEILKGPHIVIGNKIILVHKIDYALTTTQTQKQQKVS